MELTEHQVLEWLARYPEARASLLSDLKKSKSNFHLQIDPPQAQIQRKASLNNASIPQIPFCEIDLKSILRDILQTVIKLIQADRCSVFLLDKNKTELYTFAFDITHGTDAVSPVLKRNYENASPDNSRNEHPTSRQYQILEAYGLIDDSRFVKTQKIWQNAKSSNTQEQDVLTIPVGSGIAGYVAAYQVPLNIRDAYEDSRFSSEFDKRTGYKTKSILCMPIFGSPTGYSGKRELLGVSSLINKAGDGGFSEFTDADMEIFKNILTLVGMSIQAANMHQDSQSVAFESASYALENIELYRTAIMERRKCESLLKMAASLYQETSIDDLATLIVKSSEEFMFADKASLFLIDNDKQELYSTIFDSGTEKKIRFPINAGISGHVATIGTAINLANAYDHPSFNSAIDLQHNYKTVSLMCVPIFGPDRKVVGVLNMINKTEGKIQAFNDDDLQMCEGFAVFCGLALHKAIIQRQIEEQQQRLNISMELMAYHSTVRIEEVENFKKGNKSREKHEDLIKSWQFDPHSFQLDSDTLATISNQFFHCLEYGKSYDILDDTLLHYILVVRRNYRPVAYHNFAHAVSVTQAIFVWITNGMLDPFMDHLEKFAMLLSALNHDIDHRGTNNQFQKMAQTGLSQFYQTSTMERHHFNHALAVLNSSKGLNILGKLCKSDYQRCLEFIERCIMATDLGIFLDNQKKLVPLVKSTTIDPTNLNHKNLVISGLF